MVEYKIAKNYHFGFSFNPTDDEIKLGLNPKHDLTDNELSIAICDALTHEHIHRIIYKYFGLTETCLFDLIQEHFKICSNKTIKKMLKANDMRTWDEAKKKEGYKYIIEKYINRGYIDENKLKKILKGWG